MFEMPMQRRSLLVASTLTTAIVCAAAAAPAQGQTGEPEATPDDSLEQPDEKRRQWLLREGSLLVQARGTMERNPDTNWWQFTVRDDVDPRIRQTLGLQPSTLLEEMVRIEESLPDREVVFEVTGQVYVYRGRNFLLPTIAPQLIEYTSANADEAKSQAADEAETEDEEADGAEDRDDDSVEDIIGELESAVGGLARSATPVADGDAPAEPGEFESLIREQTMVHSRRGQVSRTSSGAWLFVFESDAQGLSDPPMILMPCLLLEHLEQRVWRSGASMPVLVSGRVYVFDNRNYLLPTAFQIAREQTPIHP